MVIVLTVVMAITSAAIGISTNGHNRIDGDAVANSGVFLD
jgi:hypothetical protein